MSRTYEPTQQSEFQPLLQTKMPDHEPLKIFLIILTFIVFCVMALFNGLAGASDGTGIFQNQTGSVANLYYLEVTPAGWTFSIWGVIYAWQAAWLIYALTTICRRKGDTYIYLTPLMPPVLYIFYILNNIFNVAWLFAWDGMQIIAGIPLIALTPFTLYVCLYFSLSRVYRNLGFLSSNGMKADLWLMRILVQNGMALYAAWVTVATLINVGAVLTYRDGTDVNDTFLAQDLSSTIILSVVTFELLLWFILDIFVLDKFTRYTFSPYITLTVALAGIVEKNYDLDTARRNSIFMAVLLGVAPLCLILKLVIMIWRHKTRPIEHNDTIKPTV